MDAPKALIIDDDIDIANLFAMVLSLVGYECALAHSAREALSQLAASTPDLVLLDLRLDTELGGEDILYQIRSNPRLKHTRVVVATGHPDLAEPIQAQVDYTLIKPINVEQLKQIIISLKQSAPAAKGEYFRDPVTGLYNEEFLLSRLELAVERARRRPEFIFAVCMFNVRLLQEERVVSDPLIYNQVLRQAAQSLLHNLRPTDTVARLSYDRFCTLHEELKTPEDIRVIANRLKTILMPPFRVGEAEYCLDFRLSTAVSQGAGSTAAEILRKAEQGLAG